MTNDVEYRSYEIEELRAIDENGSKKIRGHAAVFNKLSQDLGGFKEKIAPGAFRTAIQEDDVFALWNHDPNFVLGRNKAGTLQLHEDSKGLAIEIDPPDTQVARDLMVSIERGDVSSMSFGFITVADEWEHKKNNSIRTVKEARLFDVSPVTYPAYTQTDVAVRSMTNSLEQEKEQEEKETPEQEAPAQDNTAIRRRRLAMIAGRVSAGLTKEG